MIHLALCLLIAAIGVIANVSYINDDISPLEASKRPQSGSDSHSSTISEYQYSLIDKRMHANDVHMEYSYHLKDSMQEPGMLNKDTIHMFADEMELKTARHPAHDDDKDNTSFNRFAKALHSYADKVQFFPFVTSDNVTLQGTISSSFPCLSSHAV
jgi:hypothetical protein